MFHLLVNWIQEMTRQRCQEACVLQENYKQHYCRWFVHLMCFYDSEVQKYFQARTNCEPSIFPKHQYLPFNSSTATKHTRKTPHYRTIYPHVCNRVKNGSPPGQTSSLSPIGMSHAVLLSADNAASSCFWLERENPGKAKECRLNCRCQPPRLRIDWMWYQSNERALRGGGGTACIFRWNAASVADELAPSHYAVTSNLRLLAMCTQQRYQSTTGRRLGMFPQLTFTWNRMTECVGYRFFLCFLGSRGGTVTVSTHSKFPAASSYQSENTSQTSQKLITGLSKALCIIHWSSYGPPD